MATYRVFKFEHALPDQKAAGENIRVVKDAFSLFALVLPIVFILWHRLWLLLIFYLGATLIVFALSNAINPGMAFFLNLLFGLYIGLEGTAYIAAKLGFNGWAEVGAVMASDDEEAELRALARYGEVGEAQANDQVKLPTPPQATPAPQPLFQKRIKTVPAVIGDMRNHQGFGKRR